MRGAERLGGASGKDLVLVSERGEAVQVGATLLESCFEAFTVAGIGGGSRGGRRGPGGQETSRGGAGGRREAAGPTPLAPLAPAGDISSQVRKSHFPC